MIDYIDDPDNDDNESQRIIAAQPDRVSNARSALARGDTDAAAWWFYGVGKAGTQPWATDARSALRRHLAAVDARRARGEA